MASHHQAKVQISKGCVDKSVVMASKDQLEALNVQKGVQAPGTATLRASLALQSFNTFFCCQNMPANASMPGGKHRQLHICLGPAPTLQPKFASEDPAFPEAGRASG